ncbi:hypothetical protein [Pseudomonas fluorescens]|uniref:hypothetical protein n=1 Tax=Pseudomonas fluorescens TaxID=294 RepID=UPI000AA6940E|nr:hypothetical protein [Pseudomonas fluorescens]
MATVLSGCTGKAVESFTLEVDLPAQFGLVGDASYTPATGDTCKLLLKRGKRPDLKIFTAASKPVANRVSFEVPLTEQVQGCSLVLREVVFAINAKWGTRWSDVGRDYAAVYIRDRWESGMTLMTETYIQELLGQCQWLFRTVGPQHALIKGLKCNSLSTSGQLTKARAGGYVSRTGLPGNTLRVVLALTEEEQPAVRDNWVKVNGGWKRCRGESQEDIFAFCRGNVSDFKAFKMPDGRLCNIYPTCD